VRKEEKEGAERRKEQREGRSREKEGAERRKEQREGR